MEQLQHNSFNFLVQNCGGQRYVAICRNASTAKPVKVTPRWIACVCATYGWQEIWYCGRKQCPKTGHAKKWEHVGNQQSWRYEYIFIYKRMRTCKAQGWLKKGIRFAAKKLQKNTSVKKLNKTWLDSAIWRTLPKLGADCNLSQEQKHTLCKHNHLARASSNYHTKCKIIKPTHQPRLTDKHAGWQTNHLAQFPFSSKKQSWLNPFGVKGYKRFLHLVKHCCKQFDPQTKSHVQAQNNSCMKYHKENNSLCLNNFYVLQCAVTEIRLVDVDSTICKSAQQISHINPYKWVCVNQINPFNFNPSVGLALRKLCKNVWSTRAFREQLVLVQPPKKSKKTSLLTQTCQGNVNVSNQLTIKWNKIIPVKFPRWHQRRHFVIHNCETAYRIMPFHSPNYAQKMNQQWPKKFVPCKVAGLKCSSFGKNMDTRKKQHIILVFLSSLQSVV